MGLANVHRVLNTVPATMQGVGQWRSGGFFLLASPPTISAGFKISAKSMYAASQPSMQSLNIQHSAKFEIRARFNKRMLYSSDHTVQYTTINTVKLNLNTIHTTTPTIYFGGEKRSVCKVGKGCINFHFCGNTPTLQPSFHNKATNGRLDFKKAKSLLRNKLIIINRLTSIANTFNHLNTYNYEA